LISSSATGRLFLKALHNTQQRSGLCDGAVALGDAETNGFGSCGIAITGAAQQAKAFIWGDPGGHTAA